MFLLLCEDQNGVLDAHRILPDLAVCRVRWWDVTSGGHFGVCEAHSVV